MCGGNYPKRKQSNADIVPNTTYMVTNEIAKINSTRGAQHFASLPVHPGMILPLLHYLGGDALGF